MLPPPAPIVAMSSIGSCTGQSPNFPFRVMVGVRRLTRDTSVLVPPISNEMQSSTPVLPATSMADITPAAGPERAVYTGCRMAVSAPITPPLDFMISSGASTPCSRNSRSRYSM